MRSSVVIYKRGNGYVCDATGRYGGGHQGGNAGSTPDEAATIAASMMIRYGQSNPEGGDLCAPTEVTALVPEHLRSIPARGAEHLCPRCGESLNPGAMIGGAKTPAKAAAARENGKKGGRPRTDKK